MAITHAERILDWHENLSADEVPPSWMWALEDELETWFEEVSRKRKERFGGSARDDEEIDGPSMQNEFAQDRR